MTRSEHFFYLCICSASVTWKVLKPEQHESQVTSIFKRGQQWQPTFLSNNTFSETLNIFAAIPLQKVQPPRSAYIYLEQFSVPLVCPNIGLFWLGKASALCGSVKAGLPPPLSHKFLLACFQ